MSGVVLVWLFLLGLVSFYGSNFFKGGGYNSAVWSSSFECGFLAHPLKVNTFSTSLFVLLVFFVVFDLEVSLLLNATFQEDFYKSLGFYALFICLVAGGFVLEVVKGFATWHS
uniref:NADH dehydrogenase subunit 3 n=1 Tax=Dactylogyrus simplex TaxID=2736736 RepID=UPI002E7A1E63|nr:NADH dehydrogenase subunit 3 [Dactylogyrus simplex]WPS93120.1 NADH dehydrogenase subunit 3 [Dactylogyrus simplex]